MCTLKHFVPFKQTQFPIYKYVITKSQIYITREVFALLLQPSSCHLIWTRMRTNYGRHTACEKNPCALHLPQGKTAPLGVYASFWRVIDVVDLRDSTSDCSSLFSAKTYSDNQHIHKITLLLIKYLHRPSTGRGTCIKLQSLFFRTFF